jgi:hypothetical protein
MDFPYVSPRTCETEVNPNSCLDLARRIRLNIERTSTIEEMSVNSTVYGDTVTFSFVTAKSNVTFDSDGGMRIDVPKTANRRRVLARARIPPNMERILSIMETVIIGNSIQKILPVLR